MTIVPETVDENLQDMEEPISVPATIHWRNSPKKFRLIRPRHRRGLRAVLAGISNGSCVEKNSEYTIGTAISGIFLFAGSGFCC